MSALPPPSPKAGAVRLGRAPSVKDIRAGTAWPARRGSGESPMARAETVPADVVPPLTTDQGRRNSRAVHELGESDRSSRRPSRSGQDRLAFSKLEGSSSKLPVLQRLRKALGREFASNDKDMRMSLGLHQIKLRASVGQRLERLEHRAIDRYSKHRECRLAMMRKVQFEELPDHEREPLAWAFDRNDTEGLGVLDAAGLASCCWEVGLGGLGLDEKSEVHRLCSEAGDGVDLAGFGLDVVPKVRARLKEMRHNDLLRQFDLHEEEGEGTISSTAVLEIARSLGLDARSLWDQAEKFDSRVSFETFEDLVSKSREKFQLVMRQRECEVRDYFGLEESVFNHFRRDLIVLHDTFSQYDQDGDGQLCMTEMFFMIKSFGLMPKTKVERDWVERTLRLRDVSGDDAFDFPEYLNVVDDIRKHNQAVQREELLDVFQRYDRDRSGTLSVAEISSLLAHLGVMPHSRAEQEELAELILSADDDGSGTIGFEEFQTLFQQIEEKLERMRYEDEVDVAIVLGFGESQLRDFRLVFDALDLDGSGRLDLHEVHAGLLMMQTPISQENLTVLIREVQGDQSDVGDLDFLQFLELMRTLKDKKGLFLDEPQSFNADVRLLDIRVLRRSLLLFKLPKCYVVALPKEDLIDLFCRYFQVRSKSNMHEALGVKNEPELYQLAREIEVKTLKKL